MCNLYSITTNQEAICALFGVVNRFVDNLPPMPGVFPDYPAPVVRNADDERKLIMMRWGMPPPPRTGGPPVTNIRNTSSPHWRGSLRCLVPAHLGSGIWPCELEDSSPAHFPARFHSGEARRPPLSQLTDTPGRPNYINNGAVPILSNSHDAIVTSLGAGRSYFDPVTRYLA
jgi:hypothetical protein